MIKTYKLKYKYNIAPKIVETRVKLFRTLTFALREYRKQEQDAVSIALYKYKDGEYEYYMGKSALHEKSRKKRRWVKKCTIEEESSLKK